MQSAPSQSIVDIRIIDFMCILTIIIDSIYAIVTMIDAIHIFVIDLICTLTIMIGSLHLFMINYHDRSNLLHPHHHN